MQPHQYKEISPSQFHQNHEQGQDESRKSKAQLEYEQFKKIYLTSFILFQKRQELNKQSSELIKTVEEIEEGGGIQKNGNEQINVELSEEKQKVSSNNGQKRTRRKAEEISRSWECREQYCGRKYGAHASLLQHIKLKHPDAYQKYC